MNVKQPNPKIKQMNKQQECCIKEYLNPLCQFWKEKMPKSGLETVLSRHEVDWRKINAINILFRLVSLCHCKRQLFCQVGTFVRETFQYVPAGFKKHDLQIRIFHRNWLKIIAVNIIFLHMYLPTYVLTTLLLRFSAEIYKKGEIFFCLEKYLNYLL